jgi:hypothetical protein
MALRLRGSTELRVITRTGAPDPSDPTAIVPTALAPIALSSAPGGGGLAAHVTAAGDLELIAGRSFYDLGGNLLRTYDSNALGLAQISSVAPITSGRYRGNFVATDVASSELVVFSLP